MTTSATADVQRDAAVHAALAAFPDVRGYLDTATTGVPPLSAARAMQDAVQAWASGRIDAVGYDDSVERSRAAFARIVGARTADVACGPSVSVFAGLVAASLPPGSEVVVASGDFTSVLFPMLVQERRGVRVREVPLERIADSIDARTRLVAVSAVQSATGVVADLDAIATAAAAVGAEVFLDVTQAAGWLPIDASRFTYVCAGAYKWLLSPRGTALCAFAPDAAEVLPHAANWYAASEPWQTCYGTPLRLAETAKRFDVSPSWSCWAGTAPALELLAELGPAAVGGYDVALANRLRVGLGMAPSNSAIVIAEHPDAERLLQAAGIRAAVRNGRVRMSCHLPVTDDDVDRAIAALG